MCGNATYEYTRAELDGQLKVEFIDALQPAFAELSALELRPAQIPAHTAELKNAVNNALKTTWTEGRGISVHSIALNPIKLNDADRAKIQQLEDAMAMGSNPFMMAGRMANATADAMNTAAANPNGAMMGFMGMNMAGGAGGSSGGASAVKDFGEAIFEESVSVEAEEAEEAEKLFSSDLFDEENTLEENVNAANEYVISIYEDANSIKLSTLNEMQITNEVFLAWINTVETVGEYTFETLYSFVQNNN